MLKQSQINIIIETMKPYKPKKIGIFGSYSRNENRENSDIDILYSFEESVGLFKLVKLKEELERELKKKVDLVPEKYASPKIKSYVLEDLKVIYKNQKRLI